MGKKQAGRDRYRSLQRRIARALLQIDKALNRLASGRGAELLVSDLTVQLCQIKRLLEASVEGNVETPKTLFELASLDAQEIKKARQSNTSKPTQ